MLVNNPKLARAVDNLPARPGVYLFKRGSAVLYVGKAASLRDRVRSYFRSTVAAERGPRIAQMVRRADRVEHRPADSVLEALLREVDLINELHPPYNILSRDDKSFLMVLVTQEPWPRVSVKRQRDIHHKVKAVFGPFPNGQELRVALKLIRKLFPFRDTCEPPPVGGLGRPCFNAQIGLCPGVCAGWISRSDYRRLINYLIAFFRGRKKAVSRQIERLMKTEAKADNFESAKIWRDRLFGLRHIEDVALLRRSREPRVASAIGAVRVEAFDVSHLAGGESVGAMAVSENGEFNKAEYRRFRLRAPSSRRGADTWSLEETLARRLNHLEWPAPDVVAVDGGQAQINLARKVLSRYGLKTPVVGVVKDAKHRPARIIGDLPESVSPHDLFALNEEAHRLARRYHQYLYRKRML